MSSRQPARSPSIVPRPRLEGPLVAEALRATRGETSASGPAARIQILEGPRGSGRSVLLERLAGLLAAAGMLPVSIDLERAGTSPLDLARELPSGVDRAVALAGLPPADAGPGQAARVRQRIAEELGRRRPSAATLLEQTLACPAAAAGAVGRPIALLIDELGEVRHLSRHAGLKDSASIVARALAASARVCVIASVSPASRPGDLLDRLAIAAREAGSRTEIVRVPPFSESEMASLLEGAEIAPGRRAEPIESWMRATHGHPLYAAILARSQVDGGLASALAAGMTPPYGALHQECRFDYHQLVERSRGHAAVRSILNLLAGGGRGSLTEVARHLRIALPTALDYLSWLLEVGLVLRDGSGYVIADPLLAAWVRCNGPSREDPAQEALRQLETPRRALSPPSRPRGPRPGATTRRPAAYPALPPAPRGVDRLMEID